MKVTVIRLLCAVPATDVWSNEFDSLFDPIRQAGGGLHIETAYGIAHVEDMAEAINGELEKTRERALNCGFSHLPKVSEETPVSDVIALLEREIQERKTALAKLGKVFVHENDFDDTWNDAYMTAVRDIIAFVETRVTTERGTISQKKLSRDLRSGAFFASQVFNGDSDLATFDLDIDAMHDGKIPDSVLPEEQAYRYIATEEDACVAWLEAHADELPAYRGEQIAVHATQGVVAHDRDLDLVRERVAEQRLVGQVLYSSVPSDLPE